MATGRFEVQRIGAVVTCDFCSRPRRGWFLWPCVTDNYVKRNLVSVVPLRICARCAWRVMVAIFNPGSD